MIWAWHRNSFYTARAAVEEAPAYEGLGDLAKHPVVAAALIQIDMAERAIASVADEINSVFHDGETE